MPSAIFFWNKAPVVRLLIPLIAGISLQWKSGLGFGILTSVFVLCLVFLLLFFRFRLRTKYMLNAANGLTVQTWIASAGALLVWLHDVRHRPHWIGRYGQDKSGIAVTLAGPLVEKPNAYQATAVVNFLCYDRTCRPATGKIIVYFKKDEALRQLHYGSRLIFNKALQEIKSSGNPGGFDYKTYSLFQGITHQVYLRPNDFLSLPGSDKDPVTNFIYASREQVIALLRKFIRGEKEQGLAEALLIGYKNDLDKDLVQAFTQTGVVHIIAISGMHLALIYGLLVFLTRPLLSRKKWNWIRILIILTGLWLFSFMAGAQASVVRSTLMFTSIVLAHLLERKTSVYNSLALSAFLLLCYDPFWLWDAGFQLSYAAVLGIVVCYKTIYNWVYLPNPLLDGIWKSIAVSLAAQVFTTAFSLYHFHQFPVLFLLTNLVAVPLSSLVLFGEIVLCACAWLPVLARITGWLISQLIFWMNSYIERLGRVSFGIWEGFSISAVQTLLLTAFCGSLCYWIREKKNKALWICAGTILYFISLRSLSFIEAASRRKMIIYNIARYDAIDLVSGRSCIFIGDTALYREGSLSRLYLRPSRTLHRVRQIIPIDLKSFEFCGKSILIIDTILHFISNQEKRSIDILILSKSPKLLPEQLIQFFTIRQVVVSSSVPAGKARRWKADCSRLGLPCYDVSEKGAFEINL
jgi:competence protein ComEC